MYILVDAIPKRDYRRPGIPEYRRPQKGRTDGGTDRKGKSTSRSQNTDEK